MAGHGDSDRCVAPDGGTAKAWVTPVLIERTLSSFALNSPAELGDAINTGSVCC